MCSDFIIYRPLQLSSFVVVMSVTIVALPINNVDIYFHINNLMIFLMNSGATIFLVIHIYNYTFCFSLLEMSVSSVVW